LFMQHASRREGIVTTEDPHVEFVQAMDYIAHRLDALAVGDVETHFAECGDCSGTARTLREMYWSVQSWRDLDVPEDAYEFVAAGVALQAAEAAHASNQGLAARLRRWGAELHGVGLGAVRVIVAPQAVAASVVTEGLESLVAVGAAMRFVIKNALPRQPVYVSGSSTRPSPGNDTRRPVILGVTDAQLHGGGTDGRSAEVVIERVPDTETVGVRVLLSGWPDSAAPVCLVRDDDRYVASQEAKREQGILSAYFRLSAGEYTVQVGPDDL
jgi:hypothetical protein